MTTIVLPGHLLPIPELDAGTESKAVTDGLRGAATSLSDVVSATRALGRPEGWQGDDADAADHALTRFCRDADVVLAAFEPVTRACDVYVTTMVELEQRRLEVNGDFERFNGRVDGLRSRIEQSTEDQLPGLQREAEELHRDQERLLARARRLRTDVTAAEDRLIAVFQANNEDHEAERAADAPGRVDPAALADRLAGIDDPERANRWWRSLSPAERAALLLHSPDLVGRTDGLPADARDDANRTALDRDLDHLHGLQERGEELTEDQEQLLRNATKAREALLLGADRRDPVTGERIDTNLLLYVPDAFGGDGAVAVAYGDPDTADNTAVVVPGLTNDGTSIVGQGEDALNLYLSARQNGESVAAIAWMGYDAPSMTGDNVLEAGLDFGSVTMEQLAEDGGHLLSDFVDGLRASDTGDRSHLTVIGHSYGSTTAAHAATDGLAADKLVLVGSPGAGGDSDHVSDLNMPEGSVYVGSAENDPVTWLGRINDGQVSFNNPVVLGREVPLFDRLDGAGMGQDPAQESFGAKRFAVDDGTELHLENFYADGFMGNHVSYLDAGTESLSNIGTIVQGDLDGQGSPREPELVDGRDRPANEYLADWARDEAGHQYDKRVAPIVEGVEQFGRELGDRVESFRDAFR